MFLQNIIKDLIKLNPQIWPFFSTSINKTMFTVLSQSPNDLNLKISKGQTSNITVAKTKQSNSCLLSLSLSFSLSLSLLTIRVKL